MVGAPTGAGEKADPLSSLRTLCFDIDELRSGLRDAHAAIKDLSDALRNERERSTAIEASVATNHAQLLTAGEHIKSARLKADRDTQYLQSVHRELRDTDGRHNGTVENLDKTGLKLQTTADMLNETQSSVRILQARTDHLEATIRELRKALDAAEAVSRKQGDQIDHNTSDIRKLRADFDLAESRAEQLRGSHTHSAATLQQTVDSLAKTIQQTEGERIRLDMQCSKITMLEVRAKDLEFEVVQLKGACGRTADDVRNLGSITDSLSTNVRSLDGGLKHTGAELKAEHERVNDALHRLSFLQEDARDLSAKWQTTRTEVAHHRTDSIKRGAQVDRMVDTVAKLRHGLDGTDFELGDVRTAIGAPRPITPTRPETPSSARRRRTPPRSRFLGAM